MPFNGSGTFVSLPPPDFPALPGTVILASSFNANMNDLFTNGLSKCLTRDGQSPPTANIPMAGFRFTGLGNAVADTDSVPAGQVLAVRGTIGAINWDTRITNGIFEGTAASLTGPAANFPPTAELGMLYVTAQGALVNQNYITATSVYSRQKVGGVFTPWVWNLRATDENQIVNSHTQYWQVNTALGAGTGPRYACDMVKSDSVGTTYTVNRITGAAGSLPMGTRFYFSTVITSVANAANFANITLPIENVATYAGQEVTFSFWAQTSINTQVSIEFVQSFGTGGAPSAAVSTFVAKPTITSAALAFYTVTGTLPSIAGKTFGTQQDALLIKIWMDAGSNFNANTGSLGQKSATYTFTGFKIQPGRVATPAAIPDPCLELSRCRRYYVTMPTGAATGPISYNGNVTNGNGYFADCIFPVRMLFPPTVALTGVTVVNFGAPVIVNATFETFRASALATSTATNSWYAGYTADARY